jgi:hypothetical protein
MNPIEQVQAGSQAKRGVDIGIACVFVDHQHRFTALRQRRGCPDQQLGAPQDSRPETNAIARPVRARNKRRKPAA